MDDELRDALLGMEKRLNDRFDFEHAAVMARFDSEHAAVIARFDSEHAAVMARFDSERVTTMARFDRMEDKLGNLDAQQTTNIGQMAVMLGNLDSRREQIELLQGAIRAGMTAESQTVSAMQVVVTGLQGLVNRMQSQIYVINDRLDEQDRGAASHQ